MKKSFNAALTFSLIFLMVFTAALCAEASAKTANTNTTITIPGEVEINGPSIKLGDIAVIEGLNGDDLYHLQEIELGRAMLPGYEKRLSKGFILRAIEREGYSPASFRLLMPVRVKIRTSSRKLRGETIVSSAVNFLKKKINYSEDRVEIRPKFYPSDLILPDRDYELEINLTRQQNLIGDLSLTVVIKLDGDIYRKIYLGFEIKLLEEVYVARRTIEKGERVTKEDFVMDLRSLKGVQGETITDFNNTLVKDGTVKYPITAGSVLTTRYITRLDLIHRGDELVAEVVMGNIMVSTMVKACQNGTRDDYITVENLKTGNRFKARVVNAHLVRIVQ